MKINPGTGITALVATLLVACGGGGGGGGGSGGNGGGAASATATITADNAEDIIRAVGASTEIAQGLFLGLVLGLDSVSASTAKTAAQNKINSGFKALIDTAIISQGVAASGAQPGVQFSVVALCSSGSADVNESGTSITFDFNNCVDFFYDGISFPGITNGVLKIEVLSANTLQDFVVRLTWTEFSSDFEDEMFMADGSMTMDYFETNNSIQFDFSANQFDYTENSESASLTNFVYNFLFTLTEITEDGSGGVESSNYTGLVYFDITSDFVTSIDDIWPTSGQIILYGINNTKIRVTAQLNGIDALVELDLEGGEPDGGDDNYETSYTITWDELMQVT
jgi:hypothetical protein